MGLGWDGITKGTQPKAFPPEPPNNTDPDESIKRIKDDDHTLIDLNWNNIKVSVVIRRAFEKLSFTFLASGIFPRQYSRWKLPQGSDFLKESLYFSEYFR